MKDKKQKQDKKKLSKSKKIAIGLFIAIGLIAATAVTVYKLGPKISIANQTIDQAQIEPIRELVIMAIDNLHSDAVIDPKTADVYFPPSKLFIPYQETMPKNIVYSYIKASEGTPEELTITQKGLGVVQSQAYAAKNVEEFLNSVPKIQACQRGIRVYYQKSFENSELQLKETTINLDNGKTLYAYSEKECSELDILLPYVENIQEF